MKNERMLQHQNDLRTKVIDEAAEEALDKHTCPRCGNKLYFRSTNWGWVCKNWKCANFHKCNGGVVFRPSKQGWMTGEVRFVPFSEQIDEEADE